MLFRCWSVSRLDTLDRLGVYSAGCPSTSSPVPTPPCWSQVVQVWCVRRGSPPCGHPALFSPETQMWVERGRCVYWGRYCWQCTRHYLLTVTNIVLLEVILIVTRLIRLNSGPEVWSFLFVWRETKKKDQERLKWKTTKCEAEAENNRQRSRWQQQRETAYI